MQEVTNSIRNSNPYMQIDADEIEHFEKEIGLTLPSGYRNYLIEHNGGMPAKAYFSTQSDPKECLELVDLFSLGGGPEHQDLRECWCLAEEYDLGRFSEEVANYIVIGSGSGGGAVLLDCVNGDILFYEPDHPEPTLGKPISDYFEPVAETFDAFFAKLISQ